MLFAHFVNQVTLFWRDKRISDVIGSGPDPSFGSIAVVRGRASDLRKTWKLTSYGHLNVLRVEVMQLLEEAFRILGSEDVINLFGADNAWTSWTKFSFVTFVKRQSDASAWPSMAARCLRWLSATTSWRHPWGVRGAADGDRQPAEGADLCASA